MKRVLFLAVLAGAVAHGQAQSFDVIIRNLDLHDPSNAGSATLAAGSLPPASVIVNGR